MNIEQDLITKITNELARSGSTIEAETSLAGLVDSTAMMELVVWIGETYGIEVEIDEITPENFGSVKLLSGYIRGKKG
jgi:acyl carrier protein